MRIVRWVLLVAVGMTWVVSTADRVHVWQDERLLWQAALRHAPEKPRVWVNLGRQYQLLGASTLAAHSYETAMALAIAPGRAADDTIGTRSFAELNLALTRWQDGDRLAARMLIGAAHSRLPYDPTIGGVYAWMLVE